MPHDPKLTRRELIAAGTCAAILPSTDRSAGSDGSVRFIPMPGWGQTTDKLRWGVGIVCDSQDRIYVHSRSTRAVIVFDRHGRPLHHFGSEFSATGHGLTYHKDGRAEYLYFCDHGRNQVVKTDLLGRTLLRIGEIHKVGPNSIPFPFNQPTDLAVAPDGRLFVAEGYGGNRVQVFDKAGRYLQSIGGPGSGPGKFNCPHGIWVDTRKREPELYVADRSNQRIQILTLEGKFKRAISGPVSLPNGFAEHRGNLFVADLDQRVAILDRNDRLVAHLGGASSKPAGEGIAFSAPHAACVDSRGDLYVIEWAESAQVKKFRRV